MPLLFLATDKPSNWLACAVIHNIQSEIAAFVVKAILGEKQI